MTRRGEATWIYRFLARINRVELLRQESLGKPTRDIARKGKGAQAIGRQVQIAGASRTSVG
jgi:hypothetical protein